MTRAARALRPRRRGESGLMLIELLTVVAVLTVLAAIVAFNVTGVRGGTGDAACRTDVGTVQAAVDAYRDDHADARTGAPGPVPTYAQLAPYIHSAPLSCARLHPGSADDGAPVIGADGTVTGILPSDGHTRVPWQGVEGPRRAIRRPGRRRQGGDEDREHASSPYSSEDRRSRRSIRRVRTA